MRLNIGLLAPPWAAVPPPSYGGTELVVNELARGLTAEGHDVVLYATSDSTASVVTRSHQPSRWDRLGQGDVELAYVMHGYETLAGCDVVHDHTVLGPGWALALGHQSRVLTTCHGPLDGEFRSIYGEYGKRIPVVAISHGQAARAPEVPIERVIHHGIDPEDFPIGGGAGGYLLFLGRMTPDKGVHEAISIARAAGRRLLICAKLREESERAYFTREIEPLLSEDVRFIGEAAHNEKLRLLAGAEALLNPIQWPEPFGLVMIEALACATPVISRPVGAAPEIVDDGVTGFLREDHDELVQVVGRISELDRDACRRAVEERFSTRRMVSDHLALYRTMVGR